jgi:hypothetical protein
MFRSASGSVAASPSVAAAAAAPHAMATVASSAEAPQPSSHTVEPRSAEELRETSSDASSVPAHQR